MSSTPSGPPASETPPVAPTQPPGTRCVDSRELLGADREVLIVHGAETYRLTQTRNGKLILTK